MFKKMTSLFLSVALVFSLTIGPQHAAAQTLVTLPQIGTLVGPSVAYNPVIIEGMTLNPQNPFEFDFIIDTGEDNLEGEALQAEAQKMINYFLATLTVPDDEMWVNLSPYENDRIIAEGLSRTEMGRDMLVQDYMLKQLTASLMYPEEELGQEFWKKVYAKTQAKYGTTDIPTDTFNKVWIVPAGASVYVHDNNVFVENAHLKVMLEQDYLAMENNTSQAISEAGTPLEDEAKAVVREIILPAIEKEVNEGKTFANLRQIYHAMILATWYKQNVRNSFLNQAYSNQNKITGIDHVDAATKDEIYQQYVESFKQGVYNYTKEEYNPMKQDIVSNRYFSGGLKNPAEVQTASRRSVGIPTDGRTRVAAAAQLASAAQTATADADKAMMTPAIIFGPEVKYKGRNLTTEQINSFHEGGNPSAGTVHFLLFAQGRYGFWKVIRWLGTADKIVDFWLNDLDGLNTRAGRIFATYMLAEAGKNQMMEITSPYGSVEEINEAFTNTWKEEHNKAKENGDLETQEENLTFLSPDDRMTLPALGLMLGGLHWEVMALENPAGEFDPTRDPYEPWTEDGQIINQLAVETNPGDYARNELVIWSESILPGHDQIKIRWLDEGGREELPLATRNQTIANVMRSFIADKRAEEEKAGNKIERSWKYYFLGWWGANFVRHLRWGYKNGINFLASIGVSLGGLAKNAFSKFIRSIVPWMRSFVTSDEETIQEAGIPPSGGSDEEVLYSEAFPEVTLAESTQSRLHPNKPVVWVNNIVAGEMRRGAAIAIEKETGEGDKLPISVAFYIARDAQANLDKYSLETLVKVRDAFSSYVERDSAGKLKFGWDFAWMTWGDINKLDLLIEKKTRDGAMMKSSDPETQKTEDAAAVGGIDFNAGMLELSEQGQTIEFDINSAPPIDPASIGGLQATITTITPVVHYAPLLGLADPIDDEKQDFRGIDPVDKRKVLESIALEA